MLKFAQKSFHLRDRGRLHSHRPLSEPSSTDNDGF